MGALIYICRLQLAREVLERERAEAEAATQIAERERMEADMAAAAAAKERAEAEAAAAELREQKEAARRLAMFGAQTVAAMPLYGSVIACFIRRNV